MCTIHCCNIETFPVTCVFFKCNMRHCHIELSHNAECEKEEMKESERFS